MNIDILSIIVVNSNNLLILDRNGIRCRRQRQRKQLGSLQRSMDWMWQPSIRPHVLGLSCSLASMQALLFCSTCSTDPTTPKSITGWGLSMSKMSPRHKFCSLSLVLLLAGTSAPMASSNSLTLPSLSPNSSLSFPFTGRFAASSLFICYILSLVRRLSFWMPKGTQKNFCGGKWDS